MTEFVVPVLAVLLLLVLGDAGAPEVSGSVTVMAPPRVPPSSPPNSGGDVAGTEGPGGRLHTRVLNLLAPVRAEILLLLLIKSKSARYYVIFPPSVY